MANFLKEFAKDFDVQKVTSTLNKVKNAVMNYSEYEVKVRLGTQIKLGK